MAPYDPFEIALDLSINDSGLYYVRGICVEHKTGLLIFRAVAGLRNSGISAKSREIPKKTRITAKSARNISKYMSAKHI